MPQFPGFWMRRGPTSQVLLPLAALFGVAVRWRRAGYRSGRRASVRLPCPVLVVGNIFVGGTGKTPLVVWLLEELRARGWRPGVVTRGYGGDSREWPQDVGADSDPQQVGDEPVLLAQRGGCPVVAAPDRIAAARRLLAVHGCDIIVSDDGLQHYRLQRDLELVVVDAERGLGNGRLLPAGPLREPSARLQEVDLVLANGAASTLTPYTFELRLEECINLRDGGRRPLAASAFPEPVQALAGIGNPGRFFSALRVAGLQVQERPLPDHHRFTAADLALPGTAPILMTEKDAVKCRRFATGREWYVPVSAVLAPAARQRLDVLLDDLLSSARR